MLQKLILLILGFAINLGWASSILMTPCKENAWDIGVQALYLKPLYSSYRSFVITSHEKLKDTGDYWDWGYGVYGSYHFNHGNDITLSWIHFDNNFKKYGFAEVTPFTTAPILIPFNISQQDLLERINLAFGQKVTFNQSYNLGFYGGLQFSKLRITTAYNYANNIIPIAPNGFTQNRNADFNGLGPVLGMNYAYHITPCLSFIADGAVSILYGSNHYTTSYNFPPGVVQFSQYTSKKSIVANDEFKLGVNYLHPWGNGVLYFAGGYKALVYIDVIQTNLASCTGCFSDTSFALYGPYLSVRWIGS